MICFQMNQTRLANADLYAMSVACERNDFRHAIRGYWMHLFDGALYTLNRVRLVILYWMGRDGTVI